jgi:Pyridoxamine 5'-phosphate oxidase
MRWDEFATEAPELASIGEERLRSRELCMVGTLRKNGWPRISPVEPDFVDGELMLGMMARSPKARDLLRDSRILVHSTLTDRHDLAGDFKVYGRAIPVEDAERRGRYAATIKARIGWEPTDPDYHVFAVDIESAAFVTFDDTHLGLAWEPGKPLRRWSQRTA